MESDITKVVDSGLDTTRKLVAQEVDFLPKKHVSTNLLDPLHNFIAVALAESDEPVGIAERLSLASEEIRSTNAKNIVKARAIRMGTAIVCVASRTSRRQALRDLDN